MDNLKNSSMTNHRVRSVSKLNFSKKSWKDLKYITILFVGALIYSASSPIYQAVQENNVLRFERENFEKQFMDIIRIHTEYKNDETGYYEISENYDIHRLAKYLLKNYDYIDQNLYFSYKMFLVNKAENMNILFQEMSNIIYEEPELYVGVPTYKSFDDYCLEKNFIDKEGRADYSKWKTYCVTLQKMEEKDNILKLKKERQ